MPTHVCTYENPYLIIPVVLKNKLNLCIHILASTEQPSGGDDVSEAEIRKNKGRLKNGRGRTQSQGGRAGKSQGFPPNSFDRVLLDAPCSALGLRPRLFAGLVR